MNDLAQNTLWFDRWVKPYYQQPHRHYHTALHLRHMMGVASRLGIILTNNQQLALWFHDAVYVPGADNNEELSALLWRTVYAQQLDYLRRYDVNPDRVSQIILDTKAHLPTCDESALVLDLDMVILATSPEWYKQYAVQIQDEYITVPIDTFLAGRAKFLEGLAKRQIFCDPLFVATFEAQARENIQSELNSIYTVLATGDD